MRNSSVRLKTAGALSILATAILISGCETAPVTGRKQLVLIPEAQAASMGTQAYQEILAKQGRAGNSAMNRRVTEMGRRLVEAAGAAGGNWEFNVISDKTPNAFALPGGKVGVHTGLFDVVENDDQLAAVLAHEVAHVTARHSSERLSRATLVQTGLGIAGAATSQPGLTQLMAQAATLGVILPFSRTQEAEADEIGMTYMARAGYDPRGAVAVWQNFAKLGGERPPEFMSTHPSPGSRIERLRALVPKVMPIYLKNRR